MKKIRVLLTILATLSAPPANAAPLYSLQVDGLACPFCAYGIEKKLSTIEGLKAIHVDIEKGRILVTMSDSTTLTENQAREQVRKAGFTLRSMTQLEGDE